MYWYYSYIAMVYGVRACLWANWSMIKQWQASGRFPSLRTNNALPSTLNQLTLLQICLSNSVCSSETLPYICRSYAVLQTFDENLCALVEKRI